MSSDSVLLKVENIHAICNHSIAALHGVSLTVGRGEIVALIGSNGAGKTTTLKAVSNLLQSERGHIAAGQISFDGLDVLRTRPSKLVRFGLAQVLEGRHCFRSLTVEENLITGGIARKSSRREVASDLEKIYQIFPRLREKRRMLAGLVSGGEQQMTAIGRALMSRPRLLVLDEPSMGLAPLVIQTIFKTLATLNRSEGLSILLAEQNSTVALQYAHRVVVLETGVSTVTGTAAEIRKRDDIKTFYLGQGSVSGIDSNPKQLSEIISSGSVF